MFHNRTLNNKINKLHERALRLVYKNENLSFIELLDTDNSVTIHQRNLQRLAIEMYKAKNKLSPLPMQVLAAQVFLVLIQEFLLEQVVVILELACTPLMVLLPEHGTL